MLLFRRIDRCLEKLVRREKYENFYLNFDQSYRVHIPFRQGIKSSFTNWSVVYLLKAHCIQYMITHAKKERQEAVCKLE